MKPIPLFLVLLAIHTSAAFATNVVANAGFESGELAPFYQGGGSDGAENWHIISSDAHSGGFGATNVGNKQLRQDFTPILVEDIIEISLWVRNFDDAGYRVNSVDFFYLDGSQNSFPLIQPDNEWNYNNVTSKLLNGKLLTGMAFWGFSGGGPGEDRSSTDDWVIRTVPQPSSLVLPGVVSLAAALRRHRPYSPQRAAHRDDTHSCFLLFARHN